MTEQLEARLLGSKKYADVCPDTVRRVCAECAARYKKVKDAEKAAREKLHGITGAFLTGAEAARCEDAMRAYADERTDERLTAVLACHASTRERLPLMRTDAIFDRLFRAAGGCESLLDLACGIDPVYLAARGHAVTGVDISGASVRLIARFAELTGAPAKAVSGDLLCPGAWAETPCDMALLFKALPLIERQMSGAGHALLMRIPAQFIAVSFPTRTLGGRNVGMEAHYTRMMADMLPDTRIIIDSFTEGNELFCLLGEK